MAAKDYEARLGVSRMATGLVYGGEIDGRPDTTVEDRLITAIVHAIVDNAAA
jgi:hypothetical protein